MDKGALSDFMKNVCLYSTVYTKQQIQQQHQLLQIQKQRWFLWRERIELIGTSLIFILLIPAIPILSMIILNAFAHFVFYVPQSLSGSLKELKGTIGICEMETLDIDYFPFYYTTIYAKLLCQCIPFLK
jgi:hypothetical protein